MKYLLLVLSVFLLFLSSTQGWSLPPCPEDQNQRFHNCFGNFTGPSGDKYIGEWQDDKFNGQGTHTTTSGSKYVGEWRGGKRHGQGTYTHADGIVQEGFWENGHLIAGLPPCHGHYSTFHNCFGTHTTANGDKYVGEWSEGGYHGQGAYTYAGGDEYVGEFKNTDYHGQGTYTFANGDKYVGEFRDDKFHGQGTETRADGNQYVGEYRNDKRNGQGTETRADGDKYVGEWRDGKRHGQGTYTTADGRVQEGAWNDGELIASLPPCPEDQNQRFHNCFGTFINADGDKYVGEWKHDKADGQGTYTWPSGDKYVGAYRDDQRNGLGTYTHADGSKYVGEFKDGLSHGQGTYTYADGSKYVGEFRDDKRHGQGTYTTADGRVQEGAWKSGDFQRASLPPCPENPNERFHDCFGTYTHDDGSKYVGEWKDDKYHGQGTYTFANGNKYAGEYKNNKRHGQGTYTHADGAQYVGKYRDGKRHGQGTFTYADGRVEEGAWKDGEFQHARVDRSLVPEEIVPASSGTGFAVSVDGYVITNNHVIDGCEEVQIHHRGKAIPARVISSDPHNDLALLRGDFKPSYFFPLSRENPGLMQEIYVAGYPFGHEISTSVKVTRGIVSSLTGIGNNPSNIQIDAALQPGNSGGPILNVNGNVVGVAVAKLDHERVLEEFGVIPEDTNFGIKSGVVRMLLQSNNVQIPEPSTGSVPTAELADRISDGTYYLSCWMTMAQINEMRPKKVFFPNVEQH